MKTPNSTTTTYQDSKGQWRGSKTTVTVQTLFDFSKALRLPEKGLP